MQKFFLGSTAVATVLSLSVFAAQAADYSKLKTPKLQISGETTATAYAFSNKQRAQNKGKGNGHHLAMEDTRLNFDIFGKADGLGGLEYSLLVGVNANADASNHVDENRIKLKGEWGTFMVGNTRGVDDFMAVGAFNVIGGSGGFDGNYRHVVNETTGAVLTTDLKGTSKDATKYIYVTPRFEGFQVGLSFTPNSEHKGDRKLATNTSNATLKAPFDKNQVALGVNYKHLFACGVDLKLSATGLRGTTQPRERSDTNKYRNTQAYALGGVLGFKGWQFGLEFLDNGKSQESFARTNGDAGQALSAAVGYSFGPHAVALGWYGSARKLGSQGNNEKAKANVYSVTYDRKLAPGLSLYAESNLFSYKTDPNAITYADSINNLASGGSGNPQGVGNNNGHVFMVGAKVKF